MLDALEVIGDPVDELLGVAAEFLGCHRATVDATCGALRTASVKVLLFAGARCNLRSSDSFRPPEGSRSDEEVHLLLVSATSGEETPPG